MSTVQKPPESEQSFEVRHHIDHPSLWLNILHHHQELRVKDYIKAYTATGRPPAPVPDLPNTPNARHALGLPPMFSPISIESTPSISSTGTVAEKAITNPSDLPTIQVFQATKSPIEGQFQSITAQPTFSFFSYEVCSDNIAHLRPIFLHYSSYRLRNVDDRLSNPGIAALCISFGEYYASDPTSIRDTPFGQRANTGRPSILCQRFRSNRIRARQYGPWRSGCLHEHHNVCQIQ
jgi:hypothetical protein